MRVFSKCSTLILFAVMLTVLLSVTSTAKPPPQGWPPPSFDIAVEKPYVKNGDLQRINVWASEPIQEAYPTVTINGNQATYLSGSNPYYYNYTIQLTDPEGWTDVIASGTDLDGNFGSTTRTDAFCVDHTAPYIKGLWTNPTCASIGTQVDMVFCASEQLLGNPGVKVNGHTATYFWSWPKQTTGDYYYEYTYTVQESDPDGPAAIQVIGTDFAYNPIDPPYTNTTALTIDKTGPVVIMTSPPADEVHKKSNAYISLSGTATDEINSVTSVSVEIVDIDTGAGTGTWHTANYNAGTYEWQYGWGYPAAGSYRITVKAMDTLGNEGRLVRNVKLIDTNIIHVKPTGNNNNNGSTWALAKQTLSGWNGALETANPGDEIWVAAGTYVESIELEVDVGLYGGFAATETYREQRDWHTNVTILDGNNSNRVVYAPYDSTFETVIDGFTIQNSYGHPGIECYGSPTISNNIIINNMNYNNNGGGIYVNSSNNNYIGPLIIDNVIKGNSAKNGGGIYCFSSCIVKIHGNTIRTNTAENLKGGGIFLDNSPSIIANNIVAYNSSGICRLDDYQYYYPKLVHNCVYGNSEGNYARLPDPTGTDGNISVDPRLDLDNIHLLPDSPCIDAGHDWYACGCWDIDRQTRIDGMSVDIGADETVATCDWFDVKLTPASTYATITGPSIPWIEVTAHVAKRNGDVVSGVTVNFTADGGSLQNTSVVTNENGDAVTKVTIASYSGGIVTLTAAVDRCGGASQATDTCLIRFFGTSDDWPMFMHDEKHTGMSNILDATQETLTLTTWAPVQTASTYRTEGTWSYHYNPADFLTCIFEHPYIDSSPVVVGNRVVVGEWDRGTDYFNATGRVRAFDVVNDQLQTAWTYPSSGSIGGIASTPCIYDGKVYIGSTDGYLRCLNLSNGAQIWAQPTYNRSTPAVLSKIISSPVVYDGVVYIGNEASRVYAFDASTGSLVWTVELPIEDHGVSGLNTLNMTGASSTAIATVGDTDYLLFGCDDGWFYRITLGVPDPGSTLTCVNLEGCVESSPTVSDTDVFVGVSYYSYFDEERQAVRLNLDPLEILTRENMIEECRATIASGISSMFNYLYIGVDTGKDFFRLDPVTLDQLSIFSTDTYFVGSAAITTAGYAYIGNDDGYFRILSLTDLSQISSYNTGGIVCSSPAVAYNVDANHNRWVFVTTRANNGKLLAFKTIR